MGLEVKDSLFVNTCETTMAFMHGSRISSNVVKNMRIKSDERINTVLAANSSCVLVKEQYLSLHIHIWSTWS